MTTLLRPLRRWLRGCLHGDGGFTLVEIIIAVSLLGLITGAATASLITATSAARSSTAHVHQSSDAQLISAFLVKDAQAAGGSNPATGIADPTLGVFYADAAGCGAVPGLVAQFRWVEWVSTYGSHKNAASYLLNPASPTQLSRRLCRDGVASGDLLLASSIASVAPSCFPAAKCPGLPFEVMFHITETTTAATAFSYDLRAQLRSQAQIQPSSLNSGTVPLMALGGATCPSSGSFLYVNGSSSLVVQLGDAVVNTGLAGCDSMHISGHGTYAADSTSILSPGGCDTTGVAVCPPYSSYPTALADPLAGLAPPPGAGDCGITVGNPPPVGGHYQPGVYKNGLTVGSGTTATFDPGNYVFCNDVKLQGTVVAPNVLFYFANGTLTVNATASITVGSQLSGDYRDVSIWLTTNQDVTINGGSGIDSYKGILYAPLAVVNISGGTNLQIGSVIAYAINLTGGGYTTLGPGVTITTPTMGAAANGTPFSLTMVAQAGVGAYHNWTASGLPSGLTINATSGVISGTPTTAGSYVVTVGVTDSSAPVNRTTSRIYDNPSWLQVGGGALKISNPALLFDATRNTAYSAQILATGGVGAYTWAWSAATLPPGLSLNTSSGQISGTPTSTGSYPITVTVFDGTGALDTRSYTLVVNNLPVIASPLSLPTTTVGAAYLVGSSVSFGSAPFTWTVANQPAWLTINPGTGLLSGTPTTPGTTPNVIITVTDRNGAVASKAYSLQVNAAPSITAPATLPGWAILAGAYPSTTMTATGGTGSYAWSAVGLPPGVTISPAGVISGTPSTAGTYGSIAVRVTDSVGVSVTLPYSITITGPLSIAASPSLPSWDVGVAYPTTTPSAGGGSGGYVWSSSTLPPGLVINSGTGAVTGTPTTVGPYAAVVLKVTDSNGVIATRSYSMTVYSPLVYTGPGSLPNWVAGIAYPTQNFTVSGGSPSKTWSASGLPPGLSVSAGGDLTGMPSPTGLGTFNATTFSVSDGAGGGFNVGPFSITIFPALGISTAGVPSAGVVGAAYNGSLSATGGSGNFSWSAANLPPGVSMSSAGVLSGSPTTTSTYAVNFTLTDNGTGGVGGQPANTTVAFTITTYPPLAWGALPTPPTAWTANFAYPTQTFPTSGGLPSIVWSASGLPNGMSINTGTGAIFGTPTAVGATTVTVTAKDSLNQTVTKTFALTINTALSVSVSPAPTTSLIVNAAFPNVTFSATGGTGSVVLSAANVPAGMSFNAATGVLSGSPSVAGTTIITITAKDAVQATATSSFTLAVHPKPVQIALVNGGGVPGKNKVDPADTIVITFSDVLDTTSICAGWTGASPLSFTANGLSVRLKNDDPDPRVVANHDSITVSATNCSGLKFGIIDLGRSDYISVADATFTGNTNNANNDTTMTWNSGTKKLTISLGKSSPTNPGTAAISSVTTVIYTPDTAITAAGTTIAGSRSEISTSPNFFF